MTLFGTPAILALPAGIDTMTTKIWSLFQFPPQLGPRRGRVAAAAAHHGRAAARADRDHGPARLFGHRRQERRRAR